MELVDEIVRFLPALLGGGLALVLLVRLEAGTALSFRSRVGRVLALLGLVAVVISAFTKSDGWLLRLGNVWAALGFGIAHSLTFGVMPLRPAHEKWRALIAGAGLWASILFAMGLLVSSASDSVRSLHATALILLAAISLYGWVVFGMLRSKPANVLHEGHEAKAHRNCCPRCGRWFDRAEGRAPCTRCGLFVRLETIDDEAEPFERNEPAAGELAFGTSGLLHCPGCGKRARFLRGDSLCAGCGARLRVNWNIHVDVEVEVGPAKKVPREARD